MVKKSISIGLIIFVACSFAAPLFSLKVCDMPCCHQIEMSCCTKEAQVQCPMQMTSCEKSVILLLINGPKAQVSQLNDVCSSALINVVLPCPHRDVIYSEITQSLSESLPVSFLTPLRI